MLRIMFASIFSIFLQPGSTRTVLIGANRRATFFTPLDGLFLYGSPRINEVERDEKKSSAPGSIRLIIDRRIVKNHKFLANFRIILRNVFFSFFLVTIVNVTMLQFKPRLNEDRYFNEQFVIFYGHKDWHCTGR